MCEKAKHKFKRETGGEGYVSWIQPTCSCGWVGRKEFAYNDYQYSNVREQEAEHTAQVAARKVQ